MRTLEEVHEARDALVVQLVRPDLNDRQRCILSGLSVALQWVCRDDSETSVLTLMLQGGEVEGVNKAKE